MTEIATALSPLVLLVIISGLMVLITFMIYKNNELDKTFIGREIVWPKLPKRVKEVSWTILAGFSIGALGFFCGFLFG